jgi:hypothetical protein
MDDTKAIRLVSTTPFNVIDLPLSGCLYVSTQGGAPRDGRHATEVRAPSRLTVAASPTRHRPLAARVITRLRAMMAPHCITDRNARSPTGVWRKRMHCARPVHCKSSSRWRDVSK